VGEKNTTLAEELDRTVNEVDSVDSKPSQTYLRKFNHSGQRKS
jgi:hypothetical protein